jgi:TonB family protein
MNKLRHYRFSVCLLALAMVGAGGSLRAQDGTPPPAAPPVVMSRKQAAKLVMAQPAPEYPPVAKVNYLQGNVELELTVNGAGQVTRAHVLQGNAMFAASALKAARRWLYHPLATASGPSGFITTVEMKFTLQYGESELTPQQAERDFQRQIKPPQITRTDDDAHPEEVVHMRLLVNDQGEVDDMQTIPTGKAQYEAALEALRGWTFRPAHWGTLPIASYVNVDIPVETPPESRVAANAHCR